MIIRKLSFLLFVLAIFVNGFSQDAARLRIDSLERLVERKSGTEKFDAMVVLMRAQLSKNPKASLELSQQAEKLAFSIGDSLRIVKAKYAIGFIYRRIDSVSQAIRVLEDVLPIAKRNNFNEEQSKILNLIAIGYSFSGNPDRALAFHFQSIDLNERMGNKEDIAIAYHNIGFVYFKLKDYENALNFYQKSLYVKNEISSGYDLDRLLVNMALCYNQLKRYKEAEDFIKKGLQICKSECDSVFLMDAELGLGVASSQQSRKEEAIRHFESSLQIAKLLNDQRYQIENLWNLALVSESQQHPAEALDFLQEAEKIATTTSYSLSLIEIYKLYSKIYRTQNDYQNASVFQAKYIALKDSIYSEDLIKNLAKVQSNFAERENIKTIKEKDEILELRQQLIDRQLSQFVFVVAISLLSLGMVLLLLVTNRRQKQASAVIAMARNKIEEQNKQLEDQNKALDKKVKERTVELSESNRQLTDVNTELDNFLYKSSHDLSGPLASLQGLVNLAYMEPKDEFHQLRLLGDLTSQIEKMSKMLSRLSVVSEVNHASLESQKIDIEKVLVDLFEFEKKNYQSSNVQLSFKIQGDVELVSDKLLFETIVENLVTNGIKFCNTNNRAQRFVHVEISKAGSMVCLRVSDNGLGIESKPDQDVFRMFMRGSERSETGGVGLYLTKICVNRLGGNIQLEQTSGNGSTFLVQLPSDLTPILEERKRFQEAVKRKEKEALEGAGKLTSTE
ncbi:MAG: tetratricopeptide repeat-containing sensor histidine kinase [Cytophagales bacterium]|nr:tetratricopeptide repeat-containing sensor histidine kinase [Cytophagales bacterium]MCA6387446.1 tetratricopeptide repeat-containing sensor histidine kinase [Cytophagales bacterium]MCA6393066.1 tetratricopeptide repeat-containing sensor histidine kinase [Cytophagales bacterium]MCA6398879.1 tetratricopeptide repeat-containing sensor histidine kinase [Cytophagales bacterium]MCA6403850.1 tetratricopeptide repeat-containing sensor histidine kinase [Cytophagales bacterium]